MALFWGIDDAPESSPDSQPTPSSSFQPITPDDLLSAKGHCYPLYLVRLALTWVCDAHSSYRAASLIFSTLTGLGIVSGPCAETIRLWLLRVGLFLLRRPLPNYHDWVYLLDLTIQLGQHKCLVILGVSLTEFQRNGCRLNHRDVYVLSVQVLTHCSAETIDEHLLEMQKRTGTPLAMVSDHGPDVKAGIRLFQAKFPAVTEIYDITHALANLLKHELEPDARWDEFVKNCQRTRQQLQQTAGSFLQPPAWRQKARYLNLDSHLRWANNLLSVLQAKPCVSLAEQLGCKPSESQAWLEEKLGWLQIYQEDIHEWSYFQKVVKMAEEEVKHNGLRRCSWRKIVTALALAGEVPESTRAKGFRRQAIQLIREQGEKVPARESYVGSTDVLESMFGKFKELTEHSPTREISANVLMIPLFATALTADLLRTALESIHEKDVRLWVDQHLGFSPQKKKRIILAAAKDQKNRDPNPG